MIDLEIQPEALEDPRCDAARVRCLGATLGGAATVVPKARVVQVTFSPLVKSLMVEGDGAPTYGGFDGRPVPFDDVYASVARGSGVLHTDASASFGVSAGKVGQLSLYGPWVDRFAELNTPKKLLQRFGEPDRCLRVEAEGDLIGLDCYYALPQKWVRWLAAFGRPSAIVLGADAGALREGRWGGVCRTAEPTGGSNLC